MLPYGAFWEGLEDFWADLVGELGEIPFGANEYFHNILKPSLGEVKHSTQEHQQFMDDLAWQLMQTAE